MAVLIIKTCKWKDCPYHSHKQRRVYLEGRILEKTYDSVARILQRHRTKLKPIKRTIR